MVKKDATSIDLIIQFFNCTASKAIVIDTIGAGDKDLGATLHLMCHVEVHVVIQASLVAEFGLTLAAKSSK